MSSHSVWPAYDCALFVSWRQGFLDEVDLRQDTIYLEDNSRAVSESRMTGWQSDIGKHQSQGGAYQGSQIMIISNHDRLTSWQFQDMMCMLLCCLSLCVVSYEDA